ncbi:hypothetical protein BCAR13_80121 [Paraburkholderia caribensis]|nr:hypothetical protein BCAR13_80121 [Paraburkholderia caribensis]
MRGPCLGDFTKPLVITVIVRHFRGALSSPALRNHLPHNPQYYRCRVVIRVDVDALYARAVTMLKRHARIRSSVSCNQIDARDKLGSTASRALDYHSEAVARRRRRAVLVETHLQDFARLLKKA